MTYTYRSRLLKIGRLSIRQPDRWLFPVTFNGYAYGDCTTRTCLVPMRAPAMTGCRIMRAVNARFEFDKSISTFLVLPITIETIPWEADHVAYIALSRTTHVVFRLRPAVCLFDTLAAAVPYFQGP